MGRPLGGKTLLKKHRLGELDLAKLNTKELIDLIKEQDKEILEPKEDVRYSVNQKNKSQYKMASEMGINLPAKNRSGISSPVEALIDIFNMIMGSEDECKGGVSIERLNYMFVYKT